MFSHSMEIKVKLCQMIANLSLCSDKAHDFFVTGWVSVLAAWARDIDIRINVTANKSLANLDEDAAEKLLYKSKIYPLYPRQRRKNRPQLDIVFVHGILGGVFMTWRQKEERFEALRKGQISNAATTKGGSVSKPDDGDWKDGSPRPDSIIPMIQRHRAVESHTTAAAVLGFDNPMAQDFLDTIQKAKLGRDWDVVYADCPVQASRDAAGPFSVAGDHWEPADEEVIADQYTHCWAMDWLEERFPDIRVIGLNYTSTLSDWYSRYHGCGCQITQGTIETRAVEFLDHLAAAGVGQNGRPVVWVGHSMGGLIVKSIITQAMASAEEREKTVAANTKAIMFLGTPHKGTAVAKLKQHTQMLLSPSMEVREMEENAMPLLKLHERFLETLKSIKSRLEVSYYYY